MKLHHIGIVVKNINEYEKKFIYEKKIKEVVDPIQNARLCLYASYSETLIELIEPLNEKSFVWNALIKRGNHIHHLCYMHEDLEEVIIQTKKLGFLQIFGPIKATLFSDKMVIFFYTKNKEIVEFLIGD